MVDTAQDLALYARVSSSVCRLITHRYSSSFALSVRLFSRKIRWAVYGMYAFARVSDEIVDTFYDWDRAMLLKNFRRQTSEAIDKGASVHPVLHTFQRVVRTYNIESELIDTFFHSMSLDIDKTRYPTRAEYEEYIEGSVRVVALMCLRIFCENDEELYEKLRERAMHLGAAFQKLNFLRDVKTDYEQKDRFYFPNCTMEEFLSDGRKKEEIEEDILRDFSEARKSLLLLPRTSRWAVFTVYHYYFALFKKIRKVSAQQLMKGRVRVSNGVKVYLLLRSFFQLVALKKI